MKTLITDITVSNKTVWITYQNSRGKTYNGFTPFDTVKEAIDKANALMKYNVFDNDFYTNSKTTLLIK